jgi:flagellar biosynthesis regulator FlaF
MKVIPETQLNNELQTVLIPTSQLILKDSGSFRRVLSNYAAMAKFSISDGLIKT